MLTALLGIIVTAVIGFFGYIFKYFFEKMLSSIEQLNATIAELKSEIKDLRNTLTHQQKEIEELKTKKKK